MDLNYSVLVQDIIFIGSGFSITLQLMLGSLTIGLILGTILALGRYNKITALPVNCFVSVVRGTPLILQMGLFYYAIPQACGIQLNVVMAGIISFGLNSSAYVAEILRSGIDSLPKGQFEAAKTLQIPVWPMWRDLILPQVVKNVLPSLVNEVIALLKETALIATLGGMDVMRRSQVIAAEQFVYFRPIIIAGCYYYVLILFLEHIGRKLEARGKYVKNT